MRTRVNVKLRREAERSTRYGGDDAGCSSDLARAPGARNIWEWVKFDLGSMILSDGDDERRWRSR